LLFLLTPICGKPVSVGLFARRAPTSFSVATVSAVVGLRVPLSSWSLARAPTTAKLPLVLDVPRGALELFVAPFADHRSHVGWPMVLRVVRVVGDLRVLQPVVELVLVLVVNDLVASQRATERLRHHVTVFEDSPPTVRHWMAGNDHVAIASMLLCLHTRIVTALVEHYNLQRSG